MPLSIQLTSGPLIGLCSIHQSHTYAGLIEGLPTTQMNQHIIAEALASAKQLWVDPPYLIQPLETPFHRDRPYPFGEPASIPRIMCVARWRSTFETRGEIDGWAELTTLWFQPDFALPIAPDVVAQIQAIDWQKHANFREL